ncbi:UPF0481 protein At3g47200-like [Macadamia integrifolia]|uniref:UPF0481 protein At3g47200-like n=1 Tax=Macadamia integrifolia TaxID=60698 RepID=UPI001C4E8745|nr:UPF0481 protein At3g47200-like [Macadamia integrifolia]
MAHVTDTKREHKNCEDLDLITSASDAVSGLVDSIQKELTELPSFPSNCSIYRVPKQLRKIKPKAYTPRMVSIGPFHRYKKHLKPMEAHKLRYLNDLLSRKSPPNLCDYVKAMKKLEYRARQCYSEIIQLKSEDEFVKMMLVDGCFILELILRTNNPHEPRRRDDPILNATWMSQVIKCDLILLENQLPFFVLESLYKRFTGNSNSNGLDTLISRFFQDFVPQPQSNTPESSQFRRISEGAKNAFISLKRSLSVKKDQVEVNEPLLKPASTIKDKETPEAEESEEENSQAKHLLDFVRGLLLQSFSEKSENRGKFALTRSATQLNEASVEFVKVPKTCLLNITFSNGALIIPTMRIEDWTEPLLRNLIAFEQSHDAYPHEITDYAAFIDGLINSRKDVELLQKKGIIESLLGEPEEVAALFNSLLKEVSPTVVDGNYYFSSVCHELEEHYKIPRHKWKASLMHNYCNTPWAFISFLAALFLLILTVVQTIFTILQVTLSSQSYQ